MNFNFFGWIREGVKEAVLLGVSDAVDEIGTPAESSSESSQALLEVLRKRRADAGHTPAEKPGIESAKRRRLGKSLEQVATEETAK